MSPGSRPSTSSAGGSTKPRAGPPAATMATPTSATASSSAPARGRARPPAPPVTRRRANRSGSSPSEPAGGTSRSRSGRAAHTITRLPRSATLVPNSFVCGAIEDRRHDREHEREHDPADPTGRHRLRVGEHEEQEDEHLGRGDDHHQKSNPHTGAKAHRATMQCPDAATSPTPRGEPPQNVAAAARRSRRRVISTPPIRMTA